jgi:hypothetical protein
MNVDDAHSLGHSATLRAEAARGLASDPQSIRAFRESPFHFLWIVFITDFDHDTDFEIAPASVMKLPVG